jgi:hypothetical protein
MRSLSISPSLRSNFTATVALAMLTLAACGGSGSGGTGSLRVALTDAPACGYEAVNVTIEKVRVHQSSDATDADSGWSEIVLSPARRVNLLDLTNGVLEELGQTSLPAGTYTQLRLVLAANAGNTPLTNSLRFVGASSETALTTPSGQTSGLKLNTNIVVEPGQLADVVLDFDACRSVVPRGASGQYNLKPVIAVLPRIVSVGTVTGIVDPAATHVGQVSLQSQGVPVKATAADPGTGRFTLYPVPIGNYTLVVTAVDRATTVVTSVPVVQGGTTQIGTLVPPAAAASAANLAGTVSTNPVASASVRALQAITSTPTATTVEVAWTAANDTSGAYALSLPLTAPVWTAYTSSLPLGPAAPNATTGLYRIEATAGTAVKFVDNINAATPPSPLDFVFP